MLSNQQRHEVIFDSVFYWTKNRFFDQCVLVLESLITLIFCATIEGKKDYEGVSQILLCEIAGISQKTEGGSKLSEK